MNREMESKMKQVFEEILHLSYAPQKIERLGGLTNFNFKLFNGEETYVVRFPGVGTEEIINRKDESDISWVTNEIGIDAEMLYFDEKSGIKVCKYIEDAVTMDANQVKSPENMKDIAQLFSKLHTSGKVLPIPFDVFEKIKEYEDLLNSESGNFYWDDYEEVRKQIYSLKELYESYEIQRVLCHNDPLCENFIKGKDRMYLVDWEYAGMNDPMWDLADVFIEAGFTPIEEIQFKEYYFGRPSTRFEDIRIVMNKVFLDFLWSLWGKQRYACGEDLLEYANERYERAKSNLSMLMKIV